MSWTRTTRAESGNPYYNTKSAGGYSSCIEGSPTVSGLNTLCNCVGLANGAFNETYVMNTGASPGEHFQLNCDAAEFINRARSWYSNSIEVRTPNQSPPLGGLIVWGGTANHVAYISQVIDNDTVIIHQSGYNTPSWEWDIRTAKRNSNGINLWGYKGTCLGYLVNPGISDGGGVTPTDPSKYPAKVDKVIQTGPTSITITGNSNGIDGITTGSKVYINWSNSVSLTNYSKVVSASRSFSISVEKPRSAIIVSVIIEQINNNGIQSFSSVYTQKLQRSFPCVYVNNAGKFQAYEPYIKTSAGWVPYVPVIRKSDGWYSVYNTGEEKI